MSLAVRDAAPRDFGPIHQIYAHHVSNGFGTFDEVPPSRTDMEQRFVEVTSLGLPYLVAVDDSDILGYAYASPYRPRSAYRFTVEDSIYVAPEAHRRGVGALLLNNLVARCAAAGMKQLIAVIGDSGNLPSVALHQRCGFRHVGVMSDVGFKRGRWLDTVIMQRAL
jgi:phosphinothricin acetyltransferase